MGGQTIETSSPEVAHEFIDLRTQFHRAYFADQECTRRLSLVLATVLLLSGIFLVVFAPQERQGLSYFLGGALVVFAAGAAGFRRVWGKSKYLSFGADQRNQDASPKAEPMKD